MKRVYSFTRPRRRPNGTTTFLSPESHEHYLRQSCQIWELNLPYLGEKYASMRLNTPSRGTRLELATPYVRLYHLTDSADIWHGNQIGAE